jgi:inhibitor of cysteine peptidase
VALNAQDNGNRIAHPANEQLEISLAENPTTGFRWSFVDLDPSVHVTEDTYDLASDVTPGAATNHIFRLTFSEPGEYALALRLWREWEGDASIMDRYGVTVDVTDEA